MAVENNPVYVMVSEHGITRYLMRIDEGCWRILRMVTRTLKIRWWITWHYWQITLAST